MLSYLEKINGKHILLQPHLDDVPFSLSYFLDSKVMKDKKKKTVTVFGKEYFNIHNYPHTKETEKILVLEEKVWFQKAGIPLKRYELEEAGFRGITEVRKLFSPKLANNFNIGREFFDEKIYDEVVKVVNEIQNEEPDCLWIPAAIGGHIDHLLLRQVAIELCKEENTVKHVIFYEDYPYRMYSKPIAWDQVIMECWSHIGEISLEPQAIDSNRKFMNLLAYHSQITEKQLKSLVLQSEFISIWKTI